MRLQLVSRLHELHDNPLPFNLPLQPRWHVLLRGQDHRQTHQPSRPQTTTKPNRSSSPRTKPSVSPCSTCKSPKAYLQQARTMAFGPAILSPEGRGTKTPAAPEICQYQEPPPLLYAGEIRHGSQKCRRNSSCAGKKTVADSKRIAHL